jgi:hypothetical protein
MSATGHYGRDRRDYINFDFSRCLTYRFHFATRSLNELPNVLDRTNKAGTQAVNCLK